MRIRSFIALTLLGASIFCALAWINRSGESIPADALIGGLGERPDHVFVARRDSEARIVCPVTSDGEWARVWAKQLSLCSLERGWTQAQPWGVWATGLESRFTIHLDTVAPRALVMEARANPDLPEGRQQVVRLRVNGHALDRQTVARRWRRLRFELPREVLRRGTNEFAFEFEARISPLEAGRGSDYRALTAGVKELALLAADAAASSSRLRRTPTRVWDAGREVFALQESGSLVLPTLVPAGTRGLRFDVRATRSVDVDEARLVATVEDLDGGGRRRQPVVLEPWPETSHATLDAGHLAGRLVLVTLEATLGSGQLEVSAVTPVAGATTPPSSDERAAGASDYHGSRRPDIVLITLDAARADRFSFAGHHRETSPHIDRLAAESLVFANAYALAPYTLCSVPTMITGLSYLDHGVVGHEDVLNDDAVTLAESLKDAGYRTACFSATPNNSRAKGFDQGYDVFREMWTEGERHETRRAFFIARQVVDWLKRGRDDDRPLHLQVHMVPPHAPYDPPETFDLFTEPGYDGPCRGYARNLNGLDGGTILPDPECLDHLLGLYDGNIRTADNATRMILDALRRRPRWRDTVVLVTSDHGEAFFEHGRMEHNSTLYGEMLHVPFVLRLPPDWDVSGIDSERLVTLADIAPTLLAAAGADPPPHTEGVNLLGETGKLEGRHMVVRTAETRPTIGLRTLRWNMMIQPGGSAALYDLGADPGELDNLAVEQAARLAGLGRILDRRIGQAPRLKASGETADITDEERALLETLGYVR